MRHILLVDDDVDSRFICRTILTYAGFTVIECGDGESAVHLARLACPDLILMDLSLPILDGLGAVRALKGDGATSGIPVVALTAHALPPERQRAADAGFDGYLTKPIAPMRVLDEVRNRLRMTEPAAYPSTE